MRRSVEQGMQRPLVWKSVDMGVYAGRSREGRHLLKDRYDGCGLVRALSQRERGALGKIGREPKMRRGRGSRIVCEWCGKCRQGSKMAFDNGWPLIRADAGSLSFSFPFAPSVRLALSERQEDEE